MDPEDAAKQLEEEAKKLELEDKSEAVLPVPQPVKV